MTKPTTASSQTHRQTFAKQTTGATLSRAFAKQTTGATLSRAFAKQTTGARLSRAFAKYKGQHTSMSETAQGLRELHRLLQAKAEQEQKLTSGPNKIRGGQKAVTKREQELNSKKEALTKLKMNIDQKSLQMKSNESKINDLKVKLNTAGNNREFEIIKDQIAADEMANSVLELEILEAMEKSDEAEVAIGEAEEALKAAEKKQAALADAITAEEPKIQAEIEALDEQITVAEKIIPGTAKDKYNRLVRNHGPGALAPVVDGACTHCYTILSPQVQLQIKQGKLQFCGPCGRIIYPEG